MANQSYINVAGTTAYRKATGTGTDVDPFIPEFSEPGIGTTADVAASTDTGSFSLIALIKRNLVQWTTYRTEFGEQADAASLTGTLMARIRSVVTAFGLVADSSSTTGTLMARIRAGLDRLGSFGDTASSTGSVMAQLRYIGDSLNRVTSITAINESVSGDRTIITGTASKQIAITSLIFTVSAGASVTLKNGATSISGAMTITDHAADYPQPIILSTGNAFVINVSATANLRGYVIWYLI